MASLFSKTNSRCCGAVVDHSVTSWYGLFIPGIANGLVNFMFRQFFADIPQKTLDAARVDRASWMRILFQLVAVPLAVEERQTFCNQLMAGAILAAIVPVLLIFPFQRYFAQPVASTGIK